MADQNLITIFIAVTSVAILIQTGLAAGLCYMSFKMTRQAERAAAEAKRLIGPVTHMVEMLESTAVRLAQFSASSKTEMRQLESRFDETLNRLRRKLG